MKKAKILYLSDTNLSRPGGAQQSMMILIEHLKKDYEFYIVTPNEKKLFTNHIPLKGFKRFSLREQNFLNLLKLVNRLLKIIKEINPTIIHVQMPATLVIVNFLFSIRALPKHIKIVYTDRGVFGKYGKITTLSIQSLVKKADKIITTTKVNNNNYVKYLKSYERYQDKFLVIHNTAGEQFDKYIDVKKSKSKNDLNISEETLVIGFCGRYSEQKNWPLAKEIIKSLYRRFNKINFILILSTDNTNENELNANKYIKEIEGIVGSQNVKSFINVKNNKMSDLYYAMDSFIMTSKWESFGRTGIEAMSRKNIVFGTKVDGIVEVINESLFLYDSPEEVVNVLSTLCKDKSKYKFYQNYFFERYHDKFSTNINTEKHMKLYEELLGK